jgi:hypothetical protein
MSENKRYKPANGTEGEWFFNKFCYRCKNYVDFGTHEDCNWNLILAAEINEITDLDYPDEWTYDEGGNPVCTSFEK